MQTDINEQLEAVERFFKYTIDLIDPNKEETTTSKETDETHTGVDYDEIKKKVLNKRDELKDKLDEDLWKQFNKRSSYLKYALSLLPENNSSTDAMDEMESDASEELSSSSGEEDGNVDDEMASDKSKSSNDDEVAEENNSLDGKNTVDVNISRGKRIRHSIGYELMNSKVKSSDPPMNSMVESSNNSMNTQVETTLAKVEKTTTNREELRNKLRNKIQSHEAMRIKPGVDPLERKRQRRRVSKHELRKRRKLEKLQATKKLVPGSSSNGASTSEGTPAFNKDGHMLYSKFEFPGKKKKSKKLKDLPIGKNFEVLITKVEKQNEKLKKLQDSDASAAETLKQKMLWKTVLAKAEGIKVKDDTDLLKKSLTKKRGRKDRNKKGWEDRKEKLEKRLNDKDKKRKENIRKKVQDRKDRKIKRAKKRRG